MRCEEQQLFERASGSFSSASSLFSMQRKTFKKERESFSLHSSGQSSPTHRRTIQPASQQNKYDRSAQTDLVTFTEVAALSYATSLLSMSGRSMLGR